MGKGALSHKQILWDAYDMFGLFGTKPAANEEVSNPASASSNTCPTIMPTVFIPQMRKSR